MPEALGAHKLAPKAAAPKFLNSIQAAFRALRVVPRALKVASKLFALKAPKRALRILKLLGTSIPTSKLYGSHNELMVPLLVSIWPHSVAREPSLFVVLENLSCFSVFFLIRFFN